MGLNDLKYKDKNGNSISIDQFIELIQSDYKRVCSDQVGDFWISTVWLGIPCGLFMNQYFETMVFTRPNGNIEATDWEDRLMERYKTLDEAQKGHEEIVKIFERKCGENRVPREKKEEKVFV